MLAKVGNSIAMETTNTSYNKTVTGGSITPNYYSYGTADITPTPTLFNGVYTVNFTLGSGLYNGGKAKLETYNNGSLVSTSPEIAVGTDTTFSFTNIALTNGYTLKLYLMKYASGTQAITLTTNIASTKEIKYINKTAKNGANGKPRVLKDISQKATTTIYGIHTDNSRVNH